VPSIWRGLLSRVHPDTPAKHVSFSGSLVAEVSSLCISSRLRLPVTFSGRQSMCRKGLAHTGFFIRTSGVIKDARDTFEVVDAGVNQQADLVD
jgi:hypothetical protein